MQTSNLLQGVDWLGHASFRVRSDLVVYVDPWELKGAQPEGDVILVTHSHYDHLSPSDIKKLAGPGTVVVAPADCHPKLRELKLELAIETATPGAKLTVKGMPIAAHASYNAGKRFHPKEAGWVGYRFEIGGRSFYHTGDTDDIPEVRAVSADVLLIPVGGTYTMSAAEAAQVARAISPQVAVPMHWGKIVGSIEDAQAFKKQAGVAVEILEVVR